MSDSDKPQDGDLKNTARVEDGDATVEKHEARPVHIALVIDTTVSRAEFIDDAKKELHRQMEHLKETLEGVSSIEDLQITLATFGGGRVNIFNTFDDPVKVADMFNKVECVQDLTRICDTLERLNLCVERDEIPIIDAVFLIGDSVDGANFEMLPDFEDVNLGPIMNGPNYMVPNVHFADTDLNLFESGKGFGAPIISMLHASHSTTPRTHHSFSLPAKGSGIEGCPLMYNADINFADYMLATAAMVASPEAVEELKGKELVNPKIWDDIKPETIESVHEPADPPETIVVYQDRVVKEERKNWPWFAGMAATFGAGVVAGCLLCGSGEKEETVRIETVPSEPEIVNVPVPYPVYIPYHHTTRETSNDNLLDEFRRSGSQSLDDINSPINFGVGSAEITPSFAEFLDVMGELLQRNPDNLEVFVIEGHASKLGSNADNMDLSKQRALAVFEHLQTRFNITVPMYAVGCGEEDLAVDPENGPEDSRKNRRVDFQTDGVENAEFRGCELTS